MAAPATQAAPAAQAATGDEALALPRRRFTVDEYYRMAEAGILSPEERVELIDGEILQLSPIGDRHQACVDRLNQLFVRRAGDAAIVRVQGPIRLDDRTEPEPDLALLRPRPDFYASGHPRPRDVLLVVEVADTSLAYDRQIKLPRYAQAGIPEAWLLILADPGDPRAGQVAGLEVYREPSPHGYRSIRRYELGERLAPQALPDLPCTVDELLGGWKR